MKRVCHIYNYPSHYRLKIYQLLDKEYDCKFVFGDEDLKIKKFGLSELKDACYKHVTHLGHFICQFSIVSYIFKNFDYYVLTVATNDLSHWLLLLLSKLFRKKKVFVWCHGIYGYEGKASLLVRRAYFALTDGIFIYGDYAKGNMVKMGYNSNKIHVIHNSLDYDRQLAIRKIQHADSIYLEHFGNANPVLLFIGRLTKIKKLHMLIDAVYSLAQKGQQYNVVFVGDGDERQVLESKALELGLSNYVWFYGACYDEEENARLIYNADLCVSPGNVGLTSIHSLTFGTPVLTHDNFTWQMPEFEVIKDGVTGSFFVQDNVENLAKQIDNWFKNNRDNRDDIRKACYEIIDSEWNPYYQMKVFKSVFGE